MPPSQNPREHQREAEKGKARSMWVVFPIYNIMINSAILNLHSVLWLEGKMPPHVCTSTRAHVHTHIWLLVGGAVLGGCGISGGGT